MNDEQRKRAERYLAECHEYTDSYEHEKLVNDWEKKEQVAKNVVGDFIKRAGDVRGRRLIDLGFGNGLYAVAFAKAGAEVYGLEVNDVLKDIAEENVQTSNVHADLRLYDGNTFPFEDNFFDCAFSVSVLEHVSDARLFVSEAARVLKSGGVFYLAFPNKLRPKETHTGVWFLSYFPRNFAQFIMRRVFRRNTIEEINLHFVSYWALKRCLKGTGLFIRYETSGGGVRGLLKRVLATLGVHHSAILGTVMVILVKK